jgi:bifunctional non-homologous end joining protein LigD
MDYLTFQGEIPADEYGGGHVELWDTGTYECEKWRDREVMVVLHGQRVRGRYVLFQTGGRNWMIHRMDPPEDPTREPMPDDIRPAEPKPGRMPTDQQKWAFEVAWGGLRVALAVEGGRVRARIADGTDVTDLLPELGPFGRAIGSVEVALEAECVVLGSDGRPDPAVLEHRARLRSESARKRQAAQRPAVILLADVLWLEGHRTTELDQPERRRLLTELELADPRWPVVPSHRGDGTALREAAAAQGLPAVLARPLGPYASPRWIPAS